MQNLIEYLKKFNSKERFFLAGQILGNRDFTLDPGFRQKLSDLLQIQIPVDALSAMDYHIDWLYASLSLAKDEDLTKVYPNEHNIIKGQQEDIDWLIAFRGQDSYHLILIEAKGVTRWTDKQTTSKAKRLSEIFGKQGTNWEDVMPHFVIMSPAKYNSQSVEKFPEWMAPNGEVKWLELSTPELLRVSRCDEQGHENKEGRWWKVKIR